MQIHHQGRAVDQLIFVQAATLLIAFCVLSGAQAQTQTLQTPAEPSLPYVVRPTDNLSKFGRDMLTTPRAWKEVAKFNQLKDPDVIFPSQKLDIPLRCLKSKPASGKVIGAEGDVTLSGNAIGHHHKYTHPHPNKINNLRVTTPKLYAPDLQS